MYFDYHKSTPTHRANDAFLRQMLGGELKGGELPRLRPEMPEFPMVQNRSRVDCRGNALDTERDCADRERRENEDACDRDLCPTEIHAPALAMVYAPKQCWRKTFDPQTGLAHGSIFAELILPFEGCSKSNGMEGKPCK